MSNYLIVNTRTWELYSECEDLEEVQSYIDSELIDEDTSGVVVAKVTHDINVVKTAELVEI